MRVAAIGGFERLLNAHDNLRTERYVKALRNAMSDESINRELWETWPNMVGSMMPQFDAALARRARSYTVVAQEIPSLKPAVSDIAAAVLLGLMKKFPEIAEALGVTSRENLNVEALVAYVIKTKSPAAAELAGDFIRLVHPIEPEDPVLPAWQSPGKLVIAMKMAEQFKGKIPDEIRVPFIASARRMGLPRQVKAANAQNG